MTPKKIRTPKITHRPKLRAGRRTNEADGRFHNRTIEVVKKALVAAHGNALRAAKILKTSRQNVSSWIHRHEELRLLCEELAQEELDVSESVVHDARKSRDKTLALRAAMFHLNNQGHERGWGRSSVEVRGGLEHRHAHLHGKLGDLADRLTDQEIDVLEGVYRKLAETPDDEPDLIAGE